MKKNVLSLLIVTLCFTIFSTTIYAQKKGKNKGKEKQQPLVEAKAPIVEEPIVMKINGEPVTKSEFLSVYFKNNTTSKKVEASTLNEYLDLYINFRLKVKEAEALKLDTISIFTNELSGYRKQLAQPYLIDKDVNENLIKESYERSQFDVRASHILIKVSKNAIPKDTLEAYNKIFKIRKRIISGEDFHKVASETSDDPSSKDHPAQDGRPAFKGNKGDLGYFSAFDMVYPFENAAYNNKVGEVSNIFRTDFGYHILKVTERKPTLGKVHASHILITYPKDATKDDSIKIISKLGEISEKIKKGESFEELAKQYSDDKGSAQKGGSLQWFTANRMMPEFVSAIYNMKENEISTPVQTVYGWHFIKLLETKKPGSFDETKAELKMKIARDSRANKSKDFFIARLKKEYGYKEFANNLNDYLPLLDTTFNQGMWKATKADKLNKDLFILDNIKFTQKQFSEYLSKNQGDPNENVNNVLKMRYKSWVDEEIINYEDSKLESKYVDFKTLMKEYRDGILLFDLTDKKVWTKAIKDTIGLENFYQNIKNNYLYPQRVETTIYKTTDKKTAEKLQKTLQQEIAKNTKPEEIIKPFNKKKKDNVVFDNSKFIKGDNPNVDKMAWKKSVSTIITTDNKEFSIIVINNVLEPSPKPLNEVRGLVISEYQNYLEKEWLKELKNKYKVEVDQQVLNSLIQ